jgi:hypothetical protein
MNDKRLCYFQSHVFNLVSLRIVVTVRIWKFPEICTNSDNVPEATTSFQHKNKEFLEVKVTEELYILSNYTTNN